MSYLLASDDQPSAAIRPSSAFLHVEGSSAGLARAGGWAGAPWRSGARRLTAVGIACSSVGYSNRLLQRSGHRGRPPCHHPLNREPWLVAPPATPARSTWGPWILGATPKFPIVEGKHIAPPKSLRPPTPDRYLAATPQLFMKSSKWPSLIRAG